MQKRLLAAVLASMFIGSAWAEDKAIDIPEQDVPAALLSLSSQTGTQLLFTADELKNFQSKGIKGVMSVEDALTALLQGTNYIFRVSGTGAYVLQRKDKQGQLQLDEVVISAMRTDNLLSEVPASVSVVSRDDMEMKQASDIGDVMKNLPNVNFGGGPRVSGEIPTIRGYSGASVTLMVDGARRNDTTNTLRTPLYLDPYFLAGVEVVKGSASSLYGSGGNGGVMNFRTLSATDLLGADQELGADAKVGYKSGGDSRHYNARMYGKSGQFDVLLGMGHQELNVIRQGGGSYLSPNDGHIGSNMLKLGYQARANLRFELTQNNYRQNIYRANNPQVDAVAQAQLNHTTQDETIVKAASTSESGQRELDASIYHTVLKSQDDANPALGLLFASNTTDTMGGSVQNTSRLYGDTHRLTYGLDSFQDTMSTISGTAANPVNPDGKRQVTGLFLQDEIAMSREWKVVPSVRSDAYDTSVANGSLASSSSSRLSPKIAATWRATDDINLYASLGESFRAPTLGEMYQNSVSTANFFSFQSNAQLRPQVDKTTEVGAHFNRNAAFSADDNLKVHATAFQTTAADLIQSVVTGTYSRTGFGRFTNSGYGVGKGAIFQNQNVSSANRYGMELEGQYEIGSWKLGMNYSYLRVTDNSTGNNLFANPDKLALQIRHDLGNNVSTQWDSTATAAQDYDSTTLRRRSGHVVHDVYLTWMPQGKQKLRVDVGISNLFDARYMVYQSSNALANVPEMGRSINTSLSASF